MTDQTKQQTLDMLEYVTGIKAEYIGDPDSVLLGGKHYQHILAWSDRQSAAAEAAALRMAAKKFSVFAGACKDAAHIPEHGQTTADRRDLLTRTKAFQDAMAETIALITPAGTSALASMLEDKFEEGFSGGGRYEAGLEDGLNAAVTALKEANPNLSPIRISRAAIERDGRVRNEALEEAAAAFVQAESNMWIINAIRGLKSK